MLQHNTVAGDVLAKRRGSPGALAIRVMLKHNLLILEHGGQLASQFPQLFFLTRAE